MHVAGIHSSACLSAAVRRQTDLGSGVYGAQTVEPSHLYRHAGSHIYHVWPLRALARVIAFVERNTGVSLFLLCSRRHCETHARLWRAPHNIMHSLLSLLEEIRRKKKRERLSHLWPANRASQGGTSCLKGLSRQSIVIIWDPEFLTPASVLAAFLEVLRL